MMLGSVVPLYYRAYFCLKPIFPKAMWLFLRRRQAEYIRKKNSTTWPVDSAAGKRPEGFSGWPEGKRFCLVLTHDVERERGLSGVLPLLDLEKNLGFRSAFHFVGRDYEIPQELRSRIKANGFEVGLHGLHHNHLMYLSEASFRKCAERMNPILKEWDVKGFRSPSMFHQMDWMHHLYIQYDSSTFDNDPFEPQTDGVTTIFPFIVPGQDNGDRGFIELPNTLPQDHTLFVVLQEKTIDLWKKKLDWIVKHKGMALVNVHPDYIHFPEKSKSHVGYPLDYYVQFLQYVQDTYRDQYWNALPGDVADFWRREHVGIQNQLKTESRIHVTGRHICMPTYSFYESDNRVRRYAETLAKEGNSVEVLCLRRKGQSKKEILQGVQVYRIQQRTKNETNRFSYLGKLLLFLINSGTHLTIGHIRRRYDLIHVHNIPDFEVFAAMIPKLMGSKVILDIHDIVPELFGSKFGSASIYYKLLCWTEKISASFADHVIVANDLWYRNLCQRSAKPDKCTVFLNYPDSAFFSFHETDTIPEKEVFIFPGSLNYHQGLDIAIEAFALISNRHPQSEFHIYGEGPEKESLIALTMKKGLENRVKFMGTLPIDQIAKIMAKAMCGVVPKRANSFGNQAFSTKVLEFMALGVPVVISETEIDRYYFDDSNVLFFKSGDVNDLAEKMRKILEDQKMRKRLVGNARTFIQKFLWDTKKDSYLKLVNRLIE